MGGLCIQEELPIAIITGIKSLYRSKPAFAGYANRTGNSQGWLEPGGNE
jgi:hypothetical protein